MVLGALGHSYATAGKLAQATSLLDELKVLSRESYTSPVHLALVALGLGDVDGAFTDLDRAVDARAGWLVFLRADPRFDHLRLDPRFANLLRRVFGSLAEKQQAV